MTAGDKRVLLKALRAASATPTQARMAAILLGVNGLENSLEFVRLATKQPSQPALFKMPEQDIHDSTRD